VAIVGRRSNVFGLVDDDTNQPGPKGEFLPEARECLDGFEEAGLGRVAGVFGVASDHPGGAKGNLLIPTDEDIQRLPVTLPGSSDQIVLVDMPSPSWRALL